MKLWTSDTHSDINKAYEWGYANMDIVGTFHKNQVAQLILTNTDWRKAQKRVERIRNRIENKVVVEIGAGVGYAAIEMAKIAKKVVAIESDPAWNWVFTTHLYRLKTENLTWIFGDAKDFRNSFVFAKRADVAVVFTRSGVTDLEMLGYQFADQVIMYYQEYEDDRD